jgi:hypothetical protein
MFLAGAARHAPIADENNQLMILTFSGKQIV